MYKGKYSRERKRRPALWAALALALVLTLTAGGTLAYLVSNTGAVTNTFTPAKPKIEIVEKFDGEVKKEITVKNTGDINVYVRVMLVASYQDAAGVCGTHADKVPSSVLPDSDYNNTDWVKGSDGYYYYRTALASGATTNNLLAKGKTIVLNQQENCCKMHVDVLAQAIQAEPDSVVGETWSNSKVKVTGNSGTLTVKTKTQPQTN